MGGEKPGEEGRVLIKELVRYTIGCVFVQDLVVLYIITVESEDSLYY